MTLFKLANSFLMGLRSKFLIPTLTSIYSLYAQSSRVAYQPYTNIKKTDDMVNGHCSQSIKRQWMFIIILTEHHQGLYSLLPHLSYLSPSLYMFSFLLTTIPNIIILWQYFLPQPFRHFTQFSLSFVSPGWHDFDHPSADILVCQSVAQISDRKWKLTLRPHHFSRMRRMGKSNLTHYSNMITSIAIIVDRSDKWISVYDISLNHVTYLKWFVNGLLINVVLCCRCSLSKLRLVKNFWYLYT